MVSKRRNRQRRPARRDPHKNPKRRLLVICEGSATEPDYLRGFERWARNATVEVEIPDEQGVPLTLVRNARERKVRAEREARRENDDFLKYDEVWCVFDIDEHPNLHDALQLAAANKIELAISNPCFELWLLLHFRENPGARHHRNLQRVLRGYIPNYHKRLDFNSIVSGIEDATRRARRLHQDAIEENEPNRNPTTGVFLLTDSIAQNNDDR